MSEQGPLHGLSLGAIVVLVGVAIALVGVLIWTGALSWFGRLPGDVRVERPSFRFYFPFTSTVIASLALTLLARLVRSFWK